MMHFNDPAVFSSLRPVSDVSQGVSKYPRVLRSFNSLFNSGHSVYLTLELYQSDENDQFIIFYGNFVYLYICIFVTQCVYSSDF